VDALADDLVNVIYLIIGLLLLWGLSERWRTEWQTKRKRKRQQNGPQPDA
jgi:hypothetical protein